MKKQDLDKIMEGIMGLESLIKIKDKIAECLPSRFPDLRVDEVDEMAKTLLANYIQDRFKKVEDLYDYVSNRRYQLADDVIADLNK